MKKYLIIIVMFILAFTYDECHAQDKRFTVFTRTELADKNTHNSTFDYGFNVGVGINYQMTTMYFEAEVYIFPDLNGIDYTHVKGTVLGFNHHSRFEDWRFYLGALNLGLISRQGPHPMIGQEIGIEKYFNNGMYIGGQWGYDLKTDSKLWHEAQHVVWYAGIKVGIEI